MQTNRGKKFEGQFKQDWMKLPNAFALRLPDQQSGYYGTSANPCDFICYSYPNMFLLELKSHGGNTFPLSAFRQYDKLTKYQGTRGIKVGVVLWMCDHDVVLYIPISTFDKIVAEGGKSFNIKYVGDDNYKSYVIPSTKKRTYMESDWSYLIDLVATGSV